jgi:hypothetical protein
MKTRTTVWVNSLQNEGAGWSKLVGECRRHTCLVDHLAAGKGTMTASPLGKRERKRDYVIVFLDSLLFTSIYYISLSMLKPSPPVPFHSVPSTRCRQVGLTPSSTPVHTSRLSPIGSAATQSPTPRMSSGDDDPIASRAPHVPLPLTTLAGSGAVPRPPWCQPYRVARRVLPRRSSDLWSNQGIANLCEPSLRCRRIGWQWQNSRLIIYLQKLLLPATALHLLHRWSMGPRWGRSTDQGCWCLALWHSHKLEHSEMVMNWSIIDVKTGVFGPSQKEALRTG